MKICAGKFVCMLVWSLCVFGTDCGQILPRGSFFQISPKAFPQSVRLWFSRGARISPKGPLWKNLGKPAVRSVHSKSQIELIENQSLVKLYSVFQLFNGKM